MTSLGLSKIRDLLPKRGTLVFHVTSRVLLVMTVTFTVTNLFLFKTAKEKISVQIFHQLETSNNYLAYGVSQWSRGMSRSLRSLSLNNDVRSLTPRANQAIDDFSSVYPYRKWRIWTKDAKLVASTEKITNPKILAVSQQVTKNRPYFKKALDNGLSSYQLVVSSLNGRACLNLAEPIYAEGVQINDFKTATPVGVATFCLPLTDVGTDSRLTMLENLTTMSHEHNTELDLLSDDSTGRAFLLLSNDGHLILPFDKKQSLALMTPEEVIKGPYGPIVALANKRMFKPGDQVFARVKLRDKHYFVLAKQADSQWKTVEIYDEPTAFAALNRNLFLLILVQLFTLLVTAISISIACNYSLSPIKVVVSAIKRLSTGDFDFTIKTNRKGEIGSLFDSVNQTALQLKSLVANKLQNALNESQIETAQSIQQSFLVQELPQTSYSQVAASFDPAYEIGADWYDAVEMEGVLYTVVADVCDKGVPSALFMSVFRSLLRYTLIKKALDDDVDGVTELANVMTLVNNYMASTHGMSTMFATVFVSAYDPDQKTLSYVTCCHELPFILRASGDLDMLEVCGPAIGIFEGAGFTVKQTAFNTGDILFAYTDGLVDARSPDGKSFGYDATKALLRGLSEEQRHPQALVDLVNNRVTAHMADADQFDDLTILAMQAL